MRAVVLRLLVAMVTRKDSCSLFLTLRWNNQALFAIHASVVRVVPNWSGRTSMLSFIVDLSSVSKIK